MSNTKALEGTIQAIANLAASVADSTSNEYEAEIRDLRAQLAERDAQLAAEQVMCDRLANTLNFVLARTSEDAKCKFDTLEAYYAYQATRQPTQDKGEL